MGRGGYPIGLNVSFRLNKEGKVRTLGTAMVFKSFAQISVNVDNCYIYAEQKILE